MGNFVKGKNTYNVYLNGLTYPMEITADDFIIDGECVTFVLNDCQMTKVGMVKNYSNVVLVEKDFEIEKYKSIINNLTKSYNKNIKIYKYFLILTTLITITITIIFLLCV